MSPAKSFLFLGTVLLLSACADDMPRADRYNDGSIAFSVDQAAQSSFSRGGGDYPSLSFLQSIKLSEEGEEPLYLHLESAENPATYNSSTRALPVSLDDLKKFKVTAVLPDGQKKFIDNMTVEKQSDNSWLTPTKYYWPQEDALTFLCQPTDPILPSALSNLAMTSNKTFTFDYEVPLSQDNLHDADVQEDFILAINTYTKATAANGVADINFKHPLTGICFLEDETLNKESLHIKKIEISGLSGKGSCVFTGNAVSTAASTWTKEDSYDNTYTQEVDLNNNQVDVPVYTSDKVTAVAKPFMVLPHKKNELSNFKVKVTLVNGNEYEKNLSEVSSLDPGRMYVFRLSNSDALYPPVENLQGMAGNGRLSLKWEKPILPADFTNIHQCGVRIEIIQENSETHAIAPYTISTELVWNGANNKPYPNDIKDLPYFAEFMEIKDKDGNPVLDKDGKPQKIDTKTYDTFTCHVYALYYNSDHEGYSEIFSDNKAEIQRSYARTITIKPEITSEDKVFFYIPEGTKGDPENLKDDDDVAAWDWFNKTYKRTDGKLPYITYSQLESLLEDVEKGTVSLDGYVIWVPCGVNLRGSDDGDFGFPAYHENNDRLKDSEGKLTEVEKRISDANEILANLPEALTKASKDNYGIYDSQYKTALAKISRLTGCYNNPKTGMIEKVDVNDYFTKNDIMALRKFYGEGGNLLLTTFSIELVYELGVIPYNWYRIGDCKEEMRPYYHLFNEVKPTSVWFVRGNIENNDRSNHPIYKDMFKCMPSTLNIQIEGYESNKENPYIACGGDYGVEMFPLLSLGAEACENNNVVWNFGDGQKQLSLYDMERESHGKFLGTWGQIGDASIGVVMEFYPGCTTTITLSDKQIDEGLDQDEKGMGNEWLHKAFKNHGRCIAIGLGAYEFNNGMKYTPDDPTFEVKNYYQSNVHQMTRNAINYLMTAPKDKTAPPFD